MSEVGRPIKSGASRNPEGAECSGHAAGAFQECASEQHSCLGGGTGKCHIIAANVTAPSGVPSTAIGMHLKLTPINVS